MTRSLYRVRVVVGGCVASWLRSGDEYEGEQEQEAPRRLRSRVRLFNPANSAESVVVPASYVEPVGRGASK